MLGGQPDCVSYAAVVDRARAAPLTGRSSVPSTGQVRDLAGARFRSGRASVRKTGRGMLAARAARRQSVDASSELHLAHAED